MPVVEFKIATVYDSGEIPIPKIHEPILEKS